MRDLAIVIDAIPPVAVASDMADNWMLGLAEAGEADYLVSGDRRHILRLKKHKRTRIVSLAEMVRALEP